MTSETKTKTNKTTNVLLIGSNFLTASIFVRLCGFNNTHITVMDRKDPTTIMNFNQDVYNIMKKYCKNLKYRDLFNGTEFGDPKRNIKISFMFKDWVNEHLGFDVHPVDYDIIINTGSIYDTIYAKINGKETVNVNVKGLHNLLSQLPNISNTVNNDIRPLFIQCSSINVYGDQTNTNQEEEITEDSTVPNPKDLLNFTLYTQENMVKSMLGPNTDIDYMILRLGTLTGEFTPRDSLVTAAVSSLLMSEKEFTVYNGNNSIELLDINDLGILFNNIISQYKNQTIDDKVNEKYEKMVNQVYNIKAEEREEKTVIGIVKSIFATASHLPVIGKEHGIKGIDGFKLKAPKIVESLGTLHIKPFVKFDKPVSAAKAKELLGFLSMKPLVYSLLPSTANYLLNYILVDFSEAERKAFAKMMNFPTTPHPDVVEDDDRLNKDVKQLVKDVNKNIEESFENTTTSE